MTTKRLTAYELWRIDPELSLEMKLREVEDSYLGLSIWQSARGLDGTRYGSFRPIRRSMLEGRLYDIEYWDGCVSLFWADVVFDPRYSGQPGHLPFTWIPKLENPHVYHARHQPYPFQGPA